MGDVIGETISHYKVLRKLGAGGMGVVYQADDLDLNRPVALKFLAEELYENRESLERFNREARAASSLNHPNICTIYEIGQSAGKPFIAMELLEGETLGQRLRSKPFAVSEVIEFGLQLANGLQSAHAKGIVHRDIKSANLFITTEDQVKILDFGLAKQYGHREDQPLGYDAFTADSFTTTGAIVGTLDYMSPEQVLGEKLDGRSDLFSLGVVLYHMATGRPPFSGATGAAICDSILHKKPVAPCRLNPEVPDGLERVIDKLLEKDRDLRYQTASELAADLKRLKRDSDSGATSPVTWAAPIAKPGWQKGLLMGTASIFAVVALIWFFRAQSSRNAPPSHSTAATSSPWVPLTNFADSVFSPALSSDGRMLTFFRGTDSFFGSGQIYVKFLPDGEPTQLTHDDSLKMDPVFSPDGSRVAYSIPGGSWDTWVVPVLGGAPKQWLPNASGLSWTPDKRLLFSEIKSGLHMVLVTSNESRSDVREVYVPPRERGMAHRSYLSPNGKWVLLAEMENNGWLQCRIVPFDGSSAGVRVGPKGGCTVGAWSPDGKYVYVSSDSGSGFHIWRQAFPNGSPEQVTSGPSEEEGIAMAPDGKSFITSVGLATSTVWVHDGKGDRQITSQGFAGAPHFSPDGSKLYYLVGPSSDASFAFVTGKLWVADLQTGKSEPVFEDYSITRFAISKDGNKVLFAATGGDGISHIRLGRLDKRNGPRQLTFDSGEDSPVFGPSGYVFFRETEGNVNYIYRMREDGSERQKIVPNSILEFIGVSPDGNFALALVPNSDEDASITTQAFSLNKNMTPARVCYFACNPVWSADGKILYISFPVRSSSKNNLGVFAVELKNGMVLPKLPATGLRSKADLSGLKVTTIPRPYLSPGPNPSIYAFSQKVVHHNLYRVPVPLP